MGKILLVIILVWTVTCIMYAETTVQVHNDSDSKKAKVLILPFENKVNVSKFKNSELVRAITFRSFYTFIGIIPSINVPDEKILTNISYTKDTVSKVAEDQSADFVIYGDYSFEGSKNSPKVIYNLYLYSRKDSTNALSKKYVTTTEAEIFDTIDDMISQVMKSSLNIDVNIANVYFNGFTIGTERYSLFVNDKLVSEISNSDFNFNLKVLPDNDYKIIIRREWDKKDVEEAVVNLKQYKSITISHNAFAKLKINEVGNKDRNKTYTILLDNSPIPGNSYLSNFAAGQTHTIAVMDNKSNTVYKDTFFIHDGEEKTISSSEKTPGIVHFKVYSLDANFATIGADFFFSRYFWAGIGAGGSYLSANNSTFIFFSPFVELGYYLVGDMEYPFRIGAGISGRGNMFFASAEAASAYGNVPAFMPNLGVFALIEWNFIMFRPTFYGYMAGKNFGYGYGLGTALNSNTEGSYLCPV